MMSNKVYGAGSAAELAPLKKYIAIFGKFMIIESNCADSIRLLQKNSAPANTHNTYNSNAYSNIYSSTKHTQLLIPIL